MPAVLIVDGWRVVIYPNDHRPAHVHVIGADSEAVFNLHCPDGPPELRENYGVSRNTIRALRARLAERLTALCDNWRAIHGEP